MATVICRWELDPNFCHNVLPSLFSANRFGLLLNIVDVAIFDFLIQNGDRHHISIFSDEVNSSIVMIDNGKR